ncbi:long-chain fatty acid transport protein 4-like isoform X2 [Gordionus sp. m RMFG-2023]|uniref:long-chain fatty acid transport protein 4-like isoform X2 n=1 Tax=Gordionus sp. m RMFG-2023 TaxID=3053472 RepID=UPI0031FC4C36
MRNYFSFMFPSPHENQPYSLQYIFICLFLAIIPLGWIYFRKSVVKWCIISYKTIPRDLRGLSCLLRYRYRLWRFKKANGTIAGLFFSRSLRKWANEMAFLFEDQEWTYKRAADYANAVALYFYENGFGPSKNMTSQMEQPETETEGDENENAAVKEIQSSIDPSIKLLKVGYGVPPNKTSSTSENIDRKFDFGRELPQEAIYKAKNRHEILFYIYTSGTTGMPKAAMVSHVKYFYLTYLVSRTLKIRKEDVIYTPLPLYHTAGGIIGVGQSLLLGSTVVIKKKFSATSFWDDCIKYNCTVAQYIGETCRYLLARPPSDCDKDHKVRLIYGNGLRRQIWHEFVERFDIREVGEFYGATESNANMVNIDNTFGAVGFNSVLFPCFLPITLIKVDSETGEPLRSPHSGLCVKCKPGQPGELVGKIIKSDPVTTFQGYSDRAATQKKIVKNVFRTGDAAFLTGDILIQDELGYFYFMDRTGDTFRWKGENVSTMEVEHATAKVLGDKEVVVYGVPVLGMEGKAGMATVIDPTRSITPPELKRLFTELSNRLPPYAKPVFIRLSREIDMTSTFKPKKTQLCKEGFDPTLTGDDPLFYLDAANQTYSPVTQAVFWQIADQKIRL